LHGERDANDGADPYCDGHTVRSANLYSDEYTHTVRSANPYSDEHTHA
jgi:hypothetical protein